MKKKPSAKTMSAIAQLDDIMYQRAPGKKNKTKSNNKKTNSPFFPNKGSGQP